MTLSASPVDIGDLHDVMQSWRRDIHAHPELAYTEHRTSDLVASVLTECGLVVHRGLGKTGVVGVLDTGRPGPSIAFRADMDALPILEETGASYASTTPGLMHACGHDGHTSMLLGAVKALAVREDFCGRLVFIFQPAEENEGGAKAMVDDGLFERFPVEAIFGVHNFPGLPVGSVMAIPGPLTASFDSFDITITGVGGHGAMPHLSKDPAPAVTALVTALNTIVGRNCPALEPAVLTVARLSGGDALNVIPNTMHVGGSCRTFSKDIQRLIQERIVQICEGLGIAYQVEIDCQYKEFYPPVVNDVECTKAVIEALGTDPGAFHIIDKADPVMGSEDFSFFLEHCPGCFFGIGNGDSAPLHSPRYDFNDEALMVGARAWVRIAEHYLRHPTD